MIQVRQGVFETNSSSTHSITMCMKSDYDAWVNGEVYLNEGWCRSINPNNNKKFLTKNEVVEFIKEFIKESKYYRGEDVGSISDEELADKWGIYTLDTWREYNEYLEWYVSKFTTPNGDEIVAFGNYGHD